MEQHLSKEGFRRHVRAYIAVFVALAFLTLVTVTISYLDLPMTQAVAAALAIAAVKGSLVALFFMHLISEKQIIFSVLLITFLFFAALLVLPVISV